MRPSALRAAGLVPRVVVRPGRPEHPGRGLLTFPRPVGHAQPQPGPSHAWDFGMVGALFLVWGVLLGYGWAHEGTVSERAARLEAQETAERLSANADWLACQFVHTAQWFHGLPGWEELQERAAVVGEQLDAETQARCRGGW